jgi:putative ABC transport system permease protein
VIAACVVMCVLTGLLAGTLPAITASGRDPRDAINDAVRTTTPAPFRRLFVVMETSLSLVLLIGAGLMIRSFERLRSADLGFTPDGLVTATIDLPETRYRTADAARDVTTRLLARIATIPGVRTAAVVNWLPLDSAYILGDFTLRSGEPLPPNYGVLKPCVSAGYFDAMGIRVLEGRGFQPSDVASSEHVVVISRSMAKTLWPNGNAVGQQLTYWDKPGPDDWMRIVGIVDDVTRSGPHDAPMPALYLPIAQVQELFFINHLTFVARTTDDPAAVIGAMRAAVYGVDPEQPIASIATMDSHLSAVMAEPRFRSIVVLAFSVMALVMAAVGIYGVLAYAVNERTRELGIRIALGASPRRIVGAMLGAVAASAVPGVLIGLAGAAATGRLLSSFLFEVKPTDSLTYGAASAVILVVALAAGLGPARRAGRVDPVIAMK